MVIKLDDVRTQALRLMRLRGLTMIKMAGHLDLKHRQGAHRLLHSRGTIQLAKARRVAEVLGVGLWDVLDENGRWR